MDNTYQYPPSDILRAPTLDQGRFITNISSYPTPIPLKVDIAQMLVQEIEDWDEVDDEQEKLRWELLIKHAQSEIEKLNNKVEP